MRTLGISNPSYFTRQISKSESLNISWHTFDLPVHKGFGQHPENKVSEQRAGHTMPDSLAWKRTVKQFVE